MSMGWNLNESFTHTYMHTYMHTHMYLHSITLYNSTQKHTHTYTYYTLHTTHTHTRSFIIQFQNTLKLCLGHLFLNGVPLSCLQVHLLCHYYCLILPSVHESKDNSKGKEMFYLTTHSTHFIYGYMASDIC